jgi:glycosyltransferase involved in cell wall biosynthesis
VPIIIHTIHGPSFGSFQGAIPNFIYRTAEKIAAKSTHHFVVVANAMTEQYLAAGIGRPEQYSRVFSGFELTPFLAAKNDPALRQQLGISPDDIVVGKIARLFELKGHDDVFACARELVAKQPRLKFLFVGGGEWRERFGNMAKEMGLEKHFIFTGLVPPTEVHRYVGIMDMLVHLSRREGLPRALPQAMAAGKPVIAYDCDGAREVCLDGQTGFLLRAGDLATLVEKVVLLAKDPALREQLGNQGRALAAANFPVERMVDDLHQLYLRLSREHENRVNLA